VAAALTGAVLWGQGARAAEEKAQCPPEWAYYVERAGAVRESLGTDVVLLFVSRDGDVFDCLGLVDDPALIDLATLITRGMPFDRETPLGDDPALWPTNVCTTGRTRTPGLAYHLISLPRDVGILDSEACRILFTDFGDFLMKGYERSSREDDLAGAGIVSFGDGKWKSRPTRLYGLLQEFKDLTSNDLESVIW